MSLQFVSNSSELEEYHPSDPLLKHRAKFYTLRDVLFTHARLGSKDNTPSFNSIFICIKVHRCIHLKQVERKSQICDCSLDRCVQSTVELSNIWWIKDKNRIIFESLSLCEHNKILERPSPLKVHINKICHKNVGNITGSKIWNGQEKVKTPTQIKQKQS